LQVKDKRDRFKLLAKAVCLVALVYFFLASIGLMGVAFKGFGQDFAETLISTTANPFVGLFVGVLATSLIQSSSTTTSIVVGMVGSGVLTMVNAVPIILGANIGTAVTNTMVSLAHVTRREEFKRAIAGATVHDFFNLLCVSLFFPLELSFGFLRRSATALVNIIPKEVEGCTFHSPVKEAIKPTVATIEHLFLEIANLPDQVSHVILLVISVLGIFFALFFIVRIMRTLIAYQAEKLFTTVLGKSSFLAIIAGFLFTAFVQSSSITTSLLVPMVAAGIVSIETIFPITIGANIGTTVTTILASLATGNIAAMVIAFTHFLFNFLGTVIIYPIKFFRLIAINLAKGLGNISFRKRRYAFLYIIVIYFMIPAILIFWSKIFH
jgi:sodium-dependent phosphate cotransporter